MMPNMTRRSIDLNRLGGTTPVNILGDRYSSPELRNHHHTEAKSYQTTTTLLSNKRGVIYGTDYDSEHELENDLSQYELRPPPNQGGIFAMAYYHTRRALAKTLDVLYYFSRWIYLVLGYSLLFDVMALQSWPVKAVRYLAKQQRRNLRIFLLLFVALPLALLAGGYLLSALHALSLSFLDKASNPTINPSTAAPVPVLAPAPALANLPDAAHLHTAITDNQKAPAACPQYTENLDKIDKEQQSLGQELRTARDTISALQDKLDHFDKSLSFVATDLNSVQGQIAAVAVTHQDCCDQSSPEAVDKVFGAKWSSLVAQLLHQMGASDLSDLSDLVQTVNTARADIDDIKKWKLQLMAKEKDIDERLAKLKAEMAAGDELMRKYVEDKVLNSLQQLEGASKLHWSDEVKEDLTAHFSQDMRRKLDAAVSDAVAAAISHAAPLSSSEVSVGLTSDEVERMVVAALARYDADKTGLADYALESAGGVVLSTRCTEPFNLRRPRLSIWGVTLWSEPNNPRVVIQPGVVPGHCWSFQGFDGYLVIQLSRPIRPTLFTLEHIPKSVAPNGSIDSAPKHFSVYGLVSSKDDGVLLGKYTYDENGEPLQQFAVQQENIGAFPIVELRVHSNHGNREYTCLYRLRIHGQPVDTMIPVASPSDP